MGTYRVTFNQVKTAALSTLMVGSTTVLSQNAAFVSAGRMEVRSDTGDIFRLQKGVDFRIEETPEGAQPAVYGEIFGIIIQAWPKYTTSCHSCRLHASPPLQLLIRPSSQHPNTDEYFLLSGEMIVHDFDENGRHFTICNLHEGEKSLINYDPALSVGPKRYSARVMSMTSSEYDYVIKNYLDPRHWN